ncbi:ribosomal-processing cysteine protease Prp [Halalkalibacter akibai]|uniref:Ribosomal processing cysteine protease Prp n=1 Tax=Halalkalibacter akibai (strain ATCC 43226 / DSM 21942 / CIP 109018 / JCM 9157 / 1139) TaxID=1236973 RepID=W4QXC0_HALA3|nr:ribosomal-processing cysteine protease Prp [Halalkalibacter akibai]GAE36780.1 ribosomal protein [Halalkalibacter akibai JCM 9157]
MITVELRRNDNGNIVSFTMSGHADSGPHGHDLVCAGASAVSFGSVNAIAALCGVELDIEMEDEGGFLRCSVPNGLDDGAFEKVQLLLEGMLVALESIAEEYSSYIQVNDIIGR